MSLLARPSRPPAQVLYVSGQIGLNPSTMEMPEGVEEQARQALTNIGQLLRVSSSKGRAK